EAGDRLLWEQISDGVVNLHAQDPHIINPESKSAAPCLPYPAKKALDTAEISVRECLSGLHQKLSWTGPKIDLDQPVAPKDFRQRERSKNIGWSDFQRFVLRCALIFRQSDIERLLMHKIRSLRALVPDPEDHSPAPQMRRPLQTFLIPTTKSTSMCKKGIVSL